MSKQAFENYPAVVEHIQRMASTGKIERGHNWQLFTDELNAICVKANQWDKLEEKIIKCYVNEDGSENTDEDIDLMTIGEMAASAFGFL